MLHDEYIKLNDTVIFNRKYCLLIKLKISTLNMENIYSYLSNDINKIKFKKNNPKAYINRCGCNVRSLNNYIEELKYTECKNSQEMVIDISGMDLLSIKNTFSSLQFNGFITEIVKMKLNLIFTCIVSMENILSIKNICTYILEKLPYIVMPYIWLAPINCDDKPTIPYIQYANTINDLNNQYYSRIKCCELEYKEHLSCKNINCKYDYCITCIAYGFCLGQCHYEIFKKLDYNSSIRRDICFCKKKIVEGNMKIAIRYAETLKIGDMIEKYIEL